MVGISPLFVNTELVGPDHHHDYIDHDDHDDHDDHNDHHQHHHHGRIVAVIIIDIHNHGHQFIKIVLPR